MTYLDKLLNSAEVEWKMLGVDCKVLRGNRLTKKELIENGIYPVFHGGLIPLGLYDKYNRKANQTMIINTGSIGEVVWSSVDFWSSDGTFVVETSDGIDDRLLYHYLKIQEGYFKSQKREGGVPTIDRTVVENLQIPIPPLEIQQKIVAILDTLTENTTVLKAELTTELTVRKKQYEFYRGKLLNFDERTIDWLTLGEVCDVFTGGEPPENSVKGSSNNEIFKYPIFGNGVEVYGYADTYRIDKDAVTISSIGANTGTIYFRKAYFTPIIRLKVVIPKTDNLLPRFLFHYLVSINITSKSSSVPNMNASDVKKIKVPILPIIEQERIANILDKFDTLTASISEGLPKEIELRKKQYEYYRDMLLSFPK
jgi:type I restriction enzyme S subunit